MRTSNWILSPRIRGEHKKNETTTKTIIPRPGKGNLRPIPLLYTTMEGVDPIPPTIAPTVGVLFFLVTSSGRLCRSIDKICSEECKTKSWRSCERHRHKARWLETINLHIPQKCLEDGNIRGWILRSKFYNSSSSKSSALKNDAWKTILFFWNHPFLGGQVKLQRVMSVASSKNTLWFQNNSETTSCH